MAIIALRLIVCVVITPGVFVWVVARDTSELPVAALKTIAHLQADWLKARDNRFVVSDATRRFGSMAFATHRKQIVA